MECHAVIVAGFGFRARVTEAALMDAFERAGTRDVARIATAADKAGGAAFRALAERLGVPVVAVAPEALSAQETVTRSAASRAARGTGSVAEAAALCAAGQGGRLLSARVISGDGSATCALAEGEGT